MTTIHARQIQLTKMHIMKTKKILYIVSNIFPTILHTRFYPSPSIFTTLPPICILPITPGFHPFPTLHFTSLHFPSLHFTSLHFTSLHYTSLHFTTLPFTTLPFTTLHFTSLHSTSLHFTTLHFPSLHFTSLHADLSLKRPGTKPRKVYMRFVVEVGLV